MATYKGKLKQKTGSGTYDVLHPETDASNTLYSNTSSGLTASNVQAAIDEVNTKASSAQPAITDGSATIASVSSGNIVTLKAGVTQSSGSISNSSGSDITLAKVAKTGAYGDLTGTPDPMLKSIVTTKGDMIYASAASSPVRLGIGSSGQVLAVSSGGIPEWISLPTSMQFKGSVGPSGTIEWSALPTASASNSGWVYIALSDHTTAPVCKANDTLISNGISWVVIPSGDEPSGTITNIAADTGLTTASGSAITSTGTIRMNLVNATLSGNASSYEVGGASKFYALQLDKNGKPAVYVPWTDSGNTATAADNILDGSNSGTEITYAPYAAATATSTWVASDANAGKLYLGTQAPSKTTRLNYNGYLYATKLYSNANEVLAGTKTISLNGDATGSSTMSGSSTATTTISVTLANVASLAGTDFTKGYSAFTVNAKGQITGVGQTFQVINNGGTVSVVDGGLYFEKDA